jgi:uncharacterized protein Veg
MIYKQTGRTITTVIEGKPLVTTCKSAEELAEVKALFEKIDKTTSDKVKKTLTTKLLKLFKPKEEENKKAKDKKVAEIKGEKNKLKKEVKKESGRKKTDAAKEKLAEVVTSVAVVNQEEKLTQAVEVAQKIETKPAVAGARRLGEH